MVDALLEMPMNTGVEWIAGLEALADQTRSRKRACPTTTIIPALSVRLPQEHAHGQFACPQVVLSQPVRWAQPCSKTPQFDQDKPGSESSTLTDAVCGPSAAPGRGTSSVRVSLMLHQPLRSSL